METGTPPDFSWRKKSMSMMPLLSPHAWTRPPAQAGGGRKLRSFPRDSGGRPGWGLSRLASGSIARRLKQCSAAT